MARKYHPNRAQNGADRPVYPLKCRIRAEAGVTRVDIFDDIDADGDRFGTGISAKSFAEQFAGIKGPVSLHVNSCGGDVWDGLSIYNTICGHKAPVTVTVDGLAASIASVIVQAGTERVMAPGSMQMVHDAFGAVIGNEAELAKMAQTLGKVSDNLASVYASRAGGSAASWRSVMKQETWYTAEEAVAAGLADKVGERPAVLPETVDLAALGVVPGRIAAALREMPSAAGIRDGLHAAIRSAGMEPGRMRAVPRVPDQAAAAPAAALNGYPWARSLGAFLKAIGDKDDQSGARGVIRQVMEQSRLRASAGMDERIPADGGFLVPQRLLEEIQVYISDAIVWPRAKYVPLTSLQTPVPVFENLDQGSAAQALGGMTFSMVKEGAAIPASAPEFGRLTLEARKAAGYLQSVPNELVDDAPTFAGQWLPQIIGQGYAWWLDDLLISQGSGIGEPQALVNAPGALVVNRAVSDEVGVADITAVLSVLHPWSKRNGRACWLLSDQVFQWALELATITGTAPTSGVSAPQLWLDYDSEQGCWTLLGLPCYPHDHLPALGSTGDVILADLGLMLAGDRGQLTIERSQKGAGFTSNTSNFRIRARVDARYWPQSAMVTAAGQTVSPLVVLSANT